MRERKVCVHFPLFLCRPPLPSAVEYGGVSWEDEDSPRRNGIAHVSRWRIPRWVISLLGEKRQKGKKYMGDGSGGASGVG